MIMNFGPVNSVLDRQLLVKKGLNFINKLRNYNSKAIVFGPLRLI